MSTTWRRYEVLLPLNFNDVGRLFFLCGVRRRFQ